MAVPKKQLIGRAASGMVVGRGGRESFSAGPAVNRASSQGIEVFRVGLTESEGLVGLWERIGRHFSHSAPERVISFMMKALSAESDCQCERSDRIRLELLIKEMALLRVASGVYEKVVLLSLKSDGAQVRSAQDTRELMRALLALFAMRGATVNDVRRLEGLLELSDVAGKIQFYHEIRQLIRLSPLVAFRNDEQRLLLLEVCLAVLDQVVKEEERTMPSLDAGGVLYGVV